MSDKRVDILRCIGRSGSISQAARDAAVSYKAAWQAIDTLTNLAGVPLVERAVGGAGGGGAVLTVHGTRLLALADALDAARKAVHARWAQAPDAGDDVSSGVEHALARLSVRTSMRNQLPALIDSLHESGRIVRVEMKLGEAGLIASRITKESAELLGLAVGMQVVALCKATAVQVHRVDPVREPRGNQLSGTVSSVARGDSGDEVTVSLASGLQLVGFASAGSGLRTRHRVSALVDEAAVVVALAG